MATMPLLRGLFSHFFYHLAKKMKYWNEKKISVLTWCLNVWLYTSIGWTGRWMFLMDMVQIAGNSLCSIRRCLSLLLWLGTARRNKLSGFPIFPLTYRDKHSEEFLVQSSDRKKKTFACRYIISEFIFLDYVIENKLIRSAWLFKCLQELDTPKCVYLKYLLIIYEGILQSLNNSW